MKRIIPVIIIGVLILLFDMGCSTSANPNPKNAVMAIPPGTPNSGSPGATNWVGIKETTNTPILRNPQNVVIVDPNGALINEYQKPTNTLWLTNIFYHILANVTNNPSQTNILIFFQGGLNDYSDGIDRANNLSESISNDPTASYYPIFFDWDSSLITSWRDHLKYAPNESGSANWRMAFINVPADLGRAIGRIPATLFFSTKDLVDEARFLAKTIVVSSNYYNTNIAVNLRFHNFSEIKNAADELRSKGMYINITNVNKYSRAENRARMFESALVEYPGMVGALLIDTGGKEGWDQMHRRTDTMFTIPTNNYADGGAEIFASSMTNFLAGHTNFCVTIVAHSMGSIIVNEMIRRHGPGLHIRNIVYMAAACGIEDFTKCVVPFLTSNTNVTFYNLCLNWGNELAEDHVDFGNNYVANIPAEILAPHGSLLQWIDDYYSTADTRFGWTFGKVANAVQAMNVSTIPPSVYNRINIVSFGIGPLEVTGPQKHGDFTQVRFWDPNFWKGEWSTNMFYQTNIPSGNPPAPAVTSVSMASRLQERSGKLAAETQ